MNPSTDIHKPLANAVSARETTNMGNKELTSTTRDSAATRSRNSHMTQVKKAPAVGRKLDSQYATTLKRKLIRTISTLAVAHGV
jgi:hypothetical protein